YIVHAAEGDAAIAIHDEYRAGAGSRRGFGGTQHTIALGHRSVRPEVAAHRKIEWPNLAFPNSGVHDRLDRYRDGLGSKVDKGRAIELQGHHLPVGNRVPIERIKSQDNVLLSTMFAEPEALFDSGDERRQVEVGRLIANLQGWHFHSSDRQTRCHGETGSYPGKILIVLLRDEGFVKLDSCRRSIPRSGSLRASTSTQNTVRVIR